MKERILEEIRRTAEANAGAPLGSVRFTQHTGIKDSDWRGKLWARWSDALREAGFAPNELKTAYDDKFLLEKFIGLMRELGRFPVASEIKLKARSDDIFPWHNIFSRFGSKPQFAAQILQYCAGREDYNDVAALCAPIAVATAESVGVADEPTENHGQIDTKTKPGYVYMAVLKIGRERRYKIGKAVIVARRTDQISIQLPEELELIHAITTDDAYGIEDYWHRRFAVKNTNGEWFTLARQDIDAFKRRKFM